MIMEKLLSQKKNTNDVFWQAFESLNFQLLFFLAILSKSNFLLL